MVNFGYRNVAGVGWGDAARVSLVAKLFATLVEPKPAVIKQHGEATARAMAVKSNKADSTPRHVTHVPRRAHAAPRNLCPGPRRASCARRVVRSSCRALTSAASEPVAVIRRSSEVMKKMFVAAYGSVDVYMDQLLEKTCAWLIQHPFTRNHYRSLMVIFLYIYADDTKKYCNIC